MRVLVGASEKIGALTGWRRSLAAVFAGVLWAFAHVPFGAWPLVFVAGPLSFWLLQGGFSAGWLIGVTFFAVTLHWITEPFLVEPEIYGWMAPFALVGMAAGLGLFWGAAFWCARKIAPGSAIGLGVFWFLAEAGRSYVLTGFPWVLPAYIWVDTPVAQVSSVIGPYALSLLTLIIAITAFGLARVSGLIAGCLFLAAGWVWGAGVAVGGQGGDKMIVRAVQPNIPQAEKWDPAFQRRNYDLLLSLSASADQKPDVVVWPEVAVPFLIEPAEAARRDIAAFVGAPVVLGSLTESPRSNRWRNSLVALTKTGAVGGRYDKMHLVPIGEYMPMHELLAKVGIGTIAGRGPGIEPGEDASLLNLPDLPPFAASICYEGVFPKETIAASGGARWIALITNDAWFGGWAGPKQHLAQARMRAIETGLPIVRSANTGITAVIDRFGAVVAHIPMDQRGAVQVELAISDGDSLYRIWGDYFTVFLLVLLSICFVLLKNRRHPA